MTLEILLLDVFLANNHSGHKLAEQMHIVLMSFL